MNSPVPASNPTVEIASIAIIDNDFRTISVDRLPEHERADALNALASFDEDSLRDLVERGVERDRVAESPDWLDALTDPDRELGDAFVHIVTNCDALGRLIQDRHTMRRLAARIRAVAETEVHELAPEDVPEDLSPFQLIFLDYYLEDSSEDTSKAEDIASRTAEPAAETQQQVILMSSNPSVGSDRRKFRQTARVPGASFSFVAKAELDSSWKVKAHLMMLAKALPHSRVVSGYLSSVKENVEKAYAQLGNLLDDLDLGDFAHLQNLALQADGHPLGDYLSWLVSSHLMSLAFEGDLREKQDEVDALEFDTTLVHPLKLSGTIATFHHSALFARNLGPLREHPRSAVDTGRSQLPVVRLGDVYFDHERTKALVVLSADCELSFAPGGERSINESMSVLLVPGSSLPIHRPGHGQSHATTYGFEHESVVYRVDWDFEKHRSVEIQSLRDYLESERFDISGRDRLRPLYALQLQQKLSNHLFRVGSPVAPPSRIRVRAIIVQYILDDATRETPIVEQVYEFDPKDLYATYSGKAISIRITPAIAGELRRAVENLHEECAELLESGDSNIGDPHFERKVNAIMNHLDNDDKWASILGDKQLPKLEQSKPLTNGLLLGSDVDVERLNKPNVVFNVLDAYPNGLPNQS